MRFKKKFILFLGVVYFLFPSLALTQSLIEYEDIHSGRKVTIDISKALFSNGHTIKSIYICPENSKFYCMLGAIPFAVPRNLSLESPNVSWTIRGYKFVYRGIEHHHILKKDMYLHRIEFKDSQRTIWFLYSEQIGLVLFGTHSGSEKPSFILRSTCGFGAPSHM